jgi:hypothetical protein
LGPNRQQKPFLTFAKHKYGLMELTCGIITGKMMVYPGESGLVHLFQGQRNANATGHRLMLLLLHL